MSIHKIGILTAGGDCPGLNAVVRAVSKNALGHGIEVLGFKNGFDGLVRNEFINITDETVSNILTQGGTILGSSNIAFLVREILVYEFGSGCFVKIFNAVMRNTKTVFLTGL